MLLQFPIETDQFKDYRSQALERFRWGTRVPVLRQYGPESRDLGAVIVHCECCNETSAVLHAFDDLEPDLSIDVFEDEFKARIESESYGWKPQSCPKCQAKAPRPVSAIYARYLPRLERDVQFELILGAPGRIETAYHLMDAQGVATVMEGGHDHPMWRRLDAAWSLRGAWRRFIHENLHQDRVVAQPVEPGYYIGLRPFAENDLEMEKMAQPFCQWLAEMQSSGGFEVFSYLRDRELDEIPVPFGESYHSWLAGVASDIERGIIDPFVFIDVNCFVEVVERHARRYGIAVRRDPQPDTFYLFFESADLSFRVNMAPVLFRIVHEGLPFAKGLCTHFLHQLRAIAAANESIPLIRAGLPEHSIFIHRGHFLEVTGPGGERTFFGDVMRVATAHNTRTPDGLRALFEEVAPGTNPCSVQLGPRGLDGTPTILRAHG